MQSWDQGSFLVVAVLGAVAVGLTSPVLDRLPHALPLAVGHPEPAEPRPPRVEL